MDPQSLFYGRHRFRVLAGGQNWSGSPPQGSCAVGVWLFKCRLAALLAARQEVAAAVSEIRMRMQATVNSGETS